MKSKFMGDRKGSFGLRFNECCIYLLSLSIHFFVCLLFRLFVILAVSLWENSRWAFASFIISVTLAVRLSVYLFAYVSTYLGVYLNILIGLCLHIC